MYPFITLKSLIVIHENCRWTDSKSIFEGVLTFLSIFCYFRFSASDVKTLKVYLGAHDIKVGSRSEHSVIRIIKHKDFNPKTLVNDIAILTLETPATMSNTIKTVCLPTFDSTFTNQQVTVSGWGALNEGGRQPHVLHEVDVTVMSNSECGGKYNSRIPGRIESSMICAAGYNKDSCSVSFV